MRYRARPNEVDAIEWTGENLKEVQAFMAPASPLTHLTDNLGINVYDETAKYAPHTKLAFIAPGTIVVKHTRGLSVCPKTEFEDLYEAIYAAVESEPE